MGMGVLVGDDESGIAIDCLQIFAHGLLCQFGQVIYLAEMCQDKGFQARMHNLTNDSDRVHV